MEKNFREDPEAASIAHPDHLTDHPVTLSGGLQERPSMLRRLLNPLDILILLGAFVNLLVIGALTVLYFLKA